MFDKLKKQLGMKPSTDYKELLKQGATIVDVRSPAEFKKGHIEGSRNIPVGEIAGRADQLKKSGKPVITCCASGIRSANARKILQDKGIEQVYNGGGWSKLNRIIQEK